MADEFAVFVEGLESLQEVELLAPRIELAAVRAINTTTRSTRTLAARNIGRQINIPRSYLQPAKKRLYVSALAQRGKLEATITARGRATSLARYVQGTPRRGSPVRVSVKPGRTIALQRAFLIKLPAGSGGVDTKFNMGLAIRLAPGEKLTNKRNARRLQKGLYLLYGPSIDQVFLDNDKDGVAEDIAPAAAVKLETEFLRLIDTDF